MRPNATLLDRTLELRADADPSARRILGTLIPALVGCFGVSCDGSSADGNSGTHVASVSLAVTTNQLKTSVPDGLVFLPPLVAESSFRGHCLQDLPASVRIDEMDANGNVVRSLASFTKGSGPNGEHLRFHAPNAGQAVGDPDGDRDSSAYYYARWILEDTNLAPDSVYRVNVVIPTQQNGTRDLGYTDVAITSRLHAFRRVGSREYTPLLNGNTLRVKFRIDSPAVDHDRDGVYDWLDNCPSIRNADQLDTIQNGLGDACRCLRVTCAPLDDCHNRGTCQPDTGTCTSPEAVDGTACQLPGAVAQCQAGQCQLQTCRGDYSDCNGDPTDGCETRLASVTNCGACGNACVAGPNSRAVCQRHACRLLCNPHYRDCDNEPSNGCEADVRADRHNCGGCGQSCEHAEGCVGGHCTSQVCQSGFADCNGKPEDGCETDLSTDVDHCGSCNNSCSTANGTPACSIGTCGVASCNTDFADCNQDPLDGCETLLSTDVANCGSCSTVCSPPNSVPSCTAGSCGVAGCNAGYADCDTIPSNGCEVDLTSDALSCASCGNVCVMPNAAATCAAGHCGIRACSTGFGDCDGLSGNGCEIDTRDSLEDCGACGRQCAGGPLATPVCRNGRCSQVCHTSFGDCDDDSSNGCETELLSDSANCGTCGRGCNTVDGSCQMGACSSVNCSAGYADCNENPADGCEASLGTDTNNCGGCGAVCQRPNVVQSCVAGQCDFSLCQNGFSDCDGVAENGCEANIGSDLAHCGACGTVCYDSNPCTIDSCTNGHCNHIRDSQKDAFCSQGGPCISSGTCFPSGCMNLPCPLLPDERTSWWCYQTPNPGVLCVSATPQTCSNGFKWTLFCSGTCSASGQCVAANFCLGGGAPPPPDLCW